MSGKIFLHSVEAAIAQRTENLDSAPYYLLDFNHPKSRAESRVTGIGLGTASVAGVSRHLSF